MAAIVAPLSILGSTPAGGENDTLSDILEISAKFGKLRQHCKRRS